MAAEKDEFLPNEAHTGQIGSEEYPWSNGHFDSLEVDGETLTHAHHRAVLCGPDSLSGHRIILLNDTGRLILATSAEEAGAYGMIREAVNPGAAATVYRNGIMNGFSGLEPGKDYFRGTTGQLSLLPPAGGPTQLMGKAVTETEFEIDIQIAFGPL